MNNKKLSEIRQFLLSDMDEYYQIINSNEFDKYHLIGNDIKKQSCKLAFVTTQNILNYIDKIAKTIGNFDMLISLIHSGETFEKAVKEMYEYAKIECNIQMQDNTVLYNENFDKFLDYVDAEIVFCGDYAIISTSKQNYKVVLERYDKTYFDFSKVSKALRTEFMKLYDLNYELDGFSSQVIFLQKYNFIFPEVFFGNLDDANINMFVSCSSEGFNIELSSNDEYVDKQLQLVQFTKEEKLILMDKFMDFLYSEWSKELFEAIESKDQEKIEEINSSYKDAVVYITKARLEIKETSYED